MCRCRRRARPRRRTRSRTQGRPGRRSSSWRSPRSPGRRWARDRREGQGGNGDPLNAHCFFLCGQCRVLVRASVTDHGDPPRPVTRSTRPPPHTCLLQERGGTGGPVSRAGTARLRLRSPAPHCRPAGEMGPERHAGLSRRCHAEAPGPPVSAILTVNLHGRRPLGQIRDRPAIELMCHRGLTGRDEARGRLLRRPPRPGSRRGPSTVRRPTG